MGITISLGPKFSTMTSEDEKNRELDAMLLRNQLEEIYKFKVLVLGAGESGKSTVVKQLRFIHKSTKLSERELKRVKETLAENVYDCLKAMVDACGTFDIPIDDPEDQKTAEIVRDESTSKTVLSEDMGVRLHHLWKSPAIQKAFEMRDKYWVLDSVEYFMTNIERFSDESFVPEDDDIVMARVRTTGIVTTEFDQKNQNGNEDWNKVIHYEVIDVGGQRAERKKWINCFDNVKAILFVVNLAGFNMVLFEDEKKNRMHECLELFRDTVNLEIFRTTPIFLFFNKKDMFEEKLRKTNLSVCFPDYTGGNSFEEASSFVAKKFEAQMPKENMHQFRHWFVASRLRRDIKYSFEELQGHLLEMHSKRTQTEEKKVLAEAKYHRNNA